VWKVIVPEKPQREGMTKLLYMFILYLSCKHVCKYHCKELRSQGAEDVGMTDS